MVSPSSDQPYLVTQAFSSEAAVGVSAELYFGLNRQRWGRDGTGEVVTDGGMCDRLAWDGIGLEVRWNGLGGNGYEMGCDGMKRGRTEGIDTPRCTTQVRLKSRTRGTIMAWSKHDQ